MYREYAKFQREIRKIDEDTAVFVEQHFCSTEQLCAGTASSANEEAFSDARVAAQSRDCRIRVNNLSFYFNLNIQLTYSNLKVKLQTCFSQNHFFHQI